MTPPTFELVVRSGLHLGIRQSLAAGTYSVGRSMDADVVLMDPGLAPVHARFALDGDGCEVESAAGDVVLNGVRIEAGEARMVSYPADIYLNNVHVRCTRGRTSDRRRSAFMRHALGSAVILLATVLVFHGLPAGADKAAAGGDRTLRQTPWSAGCEPGCLIKGADNRATALPRAPLVAVALSTPPAASAGPGSNRLVSPPVAVPAAAEALRQQLLTAGLMAIEVTADATAITAKGTVDPAALAAWRDIEQWFDRTFGISVVLTSQVEAKSVRPSAPLTVQAIWAGSGSYVIDGRGQKMFEGALTSDGWVIERIEQSRVVLRRGADTLAVRL
jgi:type III secretion protein D